jgi:hypothetical protein
LVHNSVEPLMLNLNVSAKHGMTLTLCH